MLERDTAGELSVLQVVEIGEIGEVGIDERLVGQQPREVGGIMGILLGRPTPADGILPPAYQEFSDIPHTLTPHHFRFTLRGTEFLYKGKHRLDISTKFAEVVGGREALTLRSSMLPPSTVEHVWHDNTRQFGAIHITE